MEIQNPYYRFMNPNRSRRQNWTELAPDENL